MNLDQTDQISLLDLPDRITAGGAPEAADFEDLCNRALQAMDLPEGYAAWQQNKAARVLKLGKAAIISCSGHGADCRIQLKASRQLAEKAGLALDPQHDEIQPDQLEPGQLVRALQTFFEYAIEQSISDKFACCSLYRQCSAAACCIQADRWLALSCAYRTNLRQGRNFYA